jgi:Holliday junction resolvasome RuvABC ATP-dependent DNA helicase subunit
MNSNRNEFVRLIGCLRIHIRHLQNGLRKNDLSSIETESQQIQELLLDLLKKQRKLPKEDQQALKRRFVTLRQEALKCLEISRKILDDSLRAMLELIKSVEETSAYGSRNMGAAIVVDRKA